MTKPTPFATIMLYGTNEVIAFTSIAEVAEWSTQVAAGWVTTAEWRTRGTATVPARETITVTTAPIVGTVKRGRPRKTANGNGYNRPVTETTTESTI